MFSNKLVSQGKTSPKTEIQSCSEITVKEFLEFLKTAYQVQESLEGILTASGMTQAIDWLKLKESQFIKRNETACQTSSTPSLYKEPSASDCSSRKASSTSAKSLDIADSKSSKSHSDFLAKSCESLTAKLNEVLSEGLLDPILPLLPVMASPPHIPTRKSSISKTSDKSLASVANSNTSCVDKNSKKKGSEEAVKVAVEKSSSEVEIHVCDEVKNMKKDFYCNQKLLVEKMGYFAEVTAGQKLEDMDISVHCDVGIFEWLMKWVQKEFILEEDWPQLDAQNVIPIVVSAAFLQMEPLLEECLRYCHENMNEILRTSTNLSCLNDQILNRLAAMYTNTELDSIRDKKDKLQSKLFTKLIISLVEPEPECVRGHWDSLARTFRCEKCQQLVDPSVSLRIPCVPPCMRLQYDGSILSYHVRDPLWNINEYIEKLHKQLKSWRRVYWRLWGNAHFLYCLTCKRFFPANQLGWCLYHPDAPQFFTLDAQKAPLPVGRYPCCGDRAYRFQLLTNFRGCKFKDHSVCTKSVKDSAVLNLLLSYRHLVAEEPPELMFPERLTRLVARDMSTSDKLVCKEVFWWDGLQIVPPRPKLGLLSMFSDRGKGAEVESRAHSSDEDSQDESSNSNGSSSSGSSEESRPRTPKPVKKKRKKRTPCRLWQVHLSARSNQDTQRSYEEKTLKQMAALLNKKCPTNTESGSKHKYGKLIHRNTNPLGGIWVRLESEWKEQNVNNQQKTRPFFMTKGKQLRNCKFPQ
ncbi:uncharacterized protein KIAA1841 homolog isoform X2 [Coccinella septempunctata]|uniref:uncharacterized protein KIAA1841 homolog isoform X2 n=1 Tax=Coccinella septempunctata TaxID=41139 RepID=UPI001D096A15|nr:uncharacterized protein KIAA1841 homolog isoform X2 [Coccinella septempunctata]